MKRNDNKMKPSYIARGISRDGSARIICADTTMIVDKAAKIHETSKTMTAALGRSLTAASIMGSLLKNIEDTMTLQFRGDGPAGTIVCCADSYGNVRGYAENPQVELPANEQGKLDVGGAVGKGSIYVVKDMGMENPYVGYSPIINGEIAEDITEYFAKSEQTPTVCNLGVRVEQTGGCKAAGGFILQLLPFADETIIPKLEENCNKIKSVSALIADGKTPEDIIALVFDGIEFDMFDNMDIEYKCVCEREKYAASLIGLGVDELQEIADDGEGAEICCHFCNTKYEFSDAEIKELLNIAKQKKENAQKEQ